MHMSSTIAFREFAARGRAAKQIPALQAAVTLCRCLSMMQVPQCRNLRMMQVLHIGFLGSVWDPKNICYRSCHPDTDCDSQSLKHIWEVWLSQIVSANQLPCVSRKASRALQPQYCRPYPSTHTHARTHARTQATVPLCKPSMISSMLLLRDIRFKLP
jgi:hypothetical protein